MKPVAIITGAAGSIGFATALKFAGAGYDLLLIDKEEPAPAEFNSVNHIGDLAEEEFISSVVPVAVKNFGRVDVLVNNAAWRTIETMRTISLENWEKCLRISLTAPAFLAQAAAAKMINGGTIVNISSIMSERAGGYAPAYVCAKAGLEALTRELSVTYSRNNIRSVCVSPGYVDSAMSSDYKTGDELSQAVIDSTPLKRAASPEEIADIILWLSSPQASFINGAVIHADGGFRNNFNPYSVKKNLFPNEF